MATRAPRKSMTADDYKEKLEKAKAALKALEEKAYATELDDLIKNQNIVSAFNVIKACISLHIITHFPKLAK